jgi:hypothetical protein
VLAGVQVGFKEKILIFIFIDFDTEIQFGMHATCKPVYTVPQNKNMHACSTHL